MGRWGAGHRVGAISTHHRNAESSFITEMQSFFSPHFFKFKSEKWGRESLLNIMFFSLPIFSV